MKQKTEIFGQDIKIKKIYHSKLVSGSQSCFNLKNIFKTQFGAMFGLDARVALAIFGALSVITGATLYNAIKEAKVIAIVTELNEINKAAEAYMLDTGQNVPLEGGLAYAYRIGELVKNLSATPGWRGSYLNYKYYNTVRLLHSQYSYVRIFNRSINDDWGGVNGVDAIIPYSCSGSAEPCGYWASIKGIPESLAKVIDTYIDGVSGYKIGKLRIHDENGVFSIHLLGPPRMK